jgi:hypothetical protein
MSASSPHTKIINSTTRAKLRPLGILQKGRSRFWYDDRHWHAISIEFQPSGFTKGSYLNVAISWLWYPIHFWSFDLPHACRSWAEFHNEAQFQHDFEILADEAIAAIRDLRASSDTLQDAFQSALELVNENPGPGGWPEVHLGLLAALTGQPEQANTLLRYMADQESRGKSGVRQKAFCNKALSLLGSVDEFRNWVENNIAECRSLLRLPPLEAPVLPAR